MYWDLIVFPVVFVVVYTCGELILEGEFTTMNAIVVALIGVAGSLGVALFTTIRGRQKEEIEHTNLKEGHASILSQTKDAENRLSAKIKETSKAQCDKLDRLIESSIRSEDMQQNLKEKGIDIGNVIGNIQLLAEKNLVAEKEIKEIRSENRKLVDEKYELMWENQKLKKEIEKYKTIIRETKKDEHKIGHNIENNDIER